MIPFSPKSKPLEPLHRLNLQEAAACLAVGGIVIFPTETFYAIGCRADKSQACARIFALKGRPPHSPLPLLAADMDQAARSVQLNTAPRQLLERFWPGALSLLLPVQPGLSCQVCNGAGLASLRISPHPLAARLARLADGALTASSANFSGQTPAAHAKDLDECLLAELARKSDSSCPCGLVLAQSPDEEPAGGLPSTLAQPLATATGFRLRILREGAISAQALKDAGFHLES